MFKIAPEIMNTLIIVAVVAFGAIVHATAQLKIARDKKEKFTLVDFGILTIIAAFSGMIFGLLATLFFENQVVIILFSAVGAFLGMAGLNRLSAILLEVLISRVRVNEQNKHEK